jgi:hypothetical protein
MITATPRAPASPCGDPPTTLLVWPVLPVATPVGLILATPAPQRGEDSILPAFSTGERTVPAEPGRPLVTPRR